MVEGRALGKSEARKMIPLAEAENPGKGERYWVNVQGARSWGGPSRRLFSSGLKSWVELHLVDGLREADHLPAKRWSDYSVVWGVQGGVEHGEGTCLERPVRMLLQQS